MMLNKIFGVFESALLQALKASNSIKCLHWLQFNIVRKFNMLSLRTFLKKWLKKNSNKKIGANL